MSTKMGRICESVSETVSEEVRLQDTCLIPADEKVVILRALKNVNPESINLRQCIEDTVKNISLGKDCPKEAVSLTTCDCSEELSDIECFCRLFKSKRCYDDQELQYFVDVIECKFIEELAKLGVEQKHIVCGPGPTAEFCLVPVIIRCRGQDLENSDSSSSDPCDCVSEVPSRTCDVTRVLEGICKPRVKPVEFRHFGDLLSVESAIFEQPVKRFTVDYVGESEDVAKWGRFLDMIERVLHRNEKIIKRMKCCDDTRSLTSVLSEALATDDSQSCCGDVCTKRTITVDYFDKLNRFEDIHIFGYSTFCLNLMRWTNWTTKKWKCLMTHPHLVIHLPSMSFPCSLRNSAREQFPSLQNIQIGRIGWLVNKNTRVLYVCPGKSNYETKCRLKNFVHLARPDVSLSRLMIVEKDDECFRARSDVDGVYRSGCETLFYTPNIYRRVRYLSAGCHGFIVPGVMCKTDIFIACELRTSIVGPSLVFQEHLLNKEYVMSVLSRASIRHPPFVGVRNFIDLCEKMAELMIRLPVCWKRKWLLKINCGFCGNQNALIRLDKCYCCKDQEDLSLYLACILPRILRVNKKAYKDTKDFFVELERLGGVLMACPEGDYRTVSLGCFIEHDTAKARLCTAADVLRTRDCKDSIWTDVGYIIPQTSLPLARIQELISNLCEPLLEEPYVGYFGVDIVVFKEHDDDAEVTYWVVDINPYYTDLLSFEDWRRFCLDISDSAGSSFWDKPRKASSYGSDHRYVVCSGKLYFDGFSGNPDDFLVDLCYDLGITYSHKAKGGCMIVPLDSEKSAFLMFSFCRSRELALRNFVRALKALHSMSKKKIKSANRSVSPYITNLIRDMKDMYDIPDL